MITRRCDAALLAACLPTPAGVSRSVRAPLRRTLRGRERGPRKGIHYSLPVGSGFSNAVKRRLEERMCWRIRVSARSTQYVRKVVGLYYQVVSLSFAHIRGRASTFSRVGNASVSRCPDSREKLTIRRSSVSEGVVFHILNVFLTAYSYLQRPCKSRVLASAGQQRDFRTTS